MQVFKFGGASVKDADGVKNLSKIIDLNRDQKLLIVVSAMGKTTNALEQVSSAYFNSDSQADQLLNNIKAYHQKILIDLFQDLNHPVFDEIANTFLEIDWILEEEPHPDYSFNYDQIVSIGELVSTRIVSAYLNHVKLKNQWIDARGYIQTDNTYREGLVDWQKTEYNIQTNLIPILQNQFIVTQGFIGGTSENFTTTLGREGSDYSAAIFASSLRAESVTIWKDVSGVLTADPKLFSDTQKYEELSYTEALEMTYYGANVIHHKTIKPLQNAHIPLFVKPFLNPHESGTTIKDILHPTQQKPAIIIKNDQILLSLSTKDFSFIAEEHLSNIFAYFAKAHIKINMMQISALSFSTCFDWDEIRFENLYILLQDQFKIKYNTQLTLLTVRHFKKTLLEQLIADKTILMEQTNRHITQIVIK